MKKLILLALVTVLASSFGCAHGVDPTAGARLEVAQKQYAYVQSGEYKAKVMANARAESSPKVRAALEAGRAMLQQDLDEATPETLEHDAAAYHLAITEFRIENFEDWQNFLWNATPEQKMEATRFVMYNAPQTESMKQNIARYEKVIAISIQRLATVNTSWVKEEVARKQAIREAAQRKVAEARRRSLFYRRFGSELMLPGVSIAKSERFVSTKPRLLGSTLKRQLPLDLLHAFPTVDSQE
jgi:hypothetical protein